MIESKGDAVARPQTHSLAQKVSIPPGHRIVWVIGERSRGLEGDREIPATGALPQMLTAGWTVEYVLPIAGGGSFYFFMAPPAGAPEGAASS